MLQIRLETVVGQIVRQELQKKGREGEALYFHFDLRMGHHTGDGSDDYHQSRGLHLLYQLNPGFTYISVFSAVTDSPFDKIEDVKEWKHEITHDSCWRDIGIFSQVYFDMAQKINNMLKFKGKKEIAPKDMSEWHGFGLSDFLFKWVPVRVTKDPNDDRHYKRLVELL